MAKMIMLIGLPGSGKSTYATRYKSKNSDVAIISSEIVRKELLRDKNKHLDGTEVHKIMRDRTIDFLNSDIDVIYDATNINRKRRISFLNSLPEGTIKIGVIFATPFELCKEQNAEKVPFEVMNNMYKNFHMPCLGEGFNKLFVEKIPLYKSDLALRQLETEEALIKNAPHDNHHHTSTIGGHCLNAWKYAFEIIKRENLNFEQSYILTEACRYHDIGKWFCKQFMNRKGEHTTEAHFYGHDCVSAYIYFTTAITKPTIMNTEDYERYVFTITNLINEHMLFYSCPDVDKTLGKIYNQDFIQMLKWVHEADANAH